MLTQSTFNKLQVQLILREKLDKTYAAILTAQVSNGFHEDAKEAALLWAEGKSAAECGIGGRNVQECSRSYSCSEFQAICILNELESDPKAFEKAVLGKGGRE